MDARLRISGMTKRIDEDRNAVPTPLEVTGKYLIFNASMALLW
jgi:hypothetical protein